MDYLCSTCGKRENEPQGWRMVIELDQPGTGIRNTFIIVDRWDKSKALDPRAACFCSNDCKEKYLAIRHQQLIA